jgi:hypothetical protein
MSYNRTMKRMIDYSEKFQHLSEIAQVAPDDPELMTGVWQCVFAWLVRGVITGQVKYRLAVPLPYTVIEVQMSDGAVVVGQHCPPDLLAGVIATHGVPSAVPARSSQAISEEERDVFRTLIRLFQEDPITYLNGETP